MESILLSIIKLFCRAFNSLPLDVANRLVTVLLYAVSFFMRRMKKVAIRNLELAFPQETPEWRIGIYHESVKSFARLIVDSMRIEKIDQKWIDEHLEFPVALYNQLRIDYPNRGIVVATGHLGSFDLMGHCIPYFGRKMAFVVRRFKLKKIDAWWNGIREMGGNRVIAREGAMKNVLRSVREGLDSAILFDQNVRREHGVFVDWFGIQAATTAMPAMVALRLKAPIGVASMEYLGQDRYRVNAVQCQVTDIYENEALTHDEKIVEITRRISVEYEKMIRANPEEWFWMHKRWRTRPEGDSRDFYERL